MDKTELTLAASDGAPQASILTPDVRSGSSFTYSGGGTDTIPAFLVVWFYTVDKQHDFALNIQAFEAVATQQLPAGVLYRGTYSVSISAVASELEYRTVWGLETLAKLQDLNDYLRNLAPQQLKDALGLIKRPMRSEIMGRTQNAAPLISR